MWLFGGRRLQKRMIDGVLIEGLGFDFEVACQEAASGKDDRWSLD